MGKHESWRQRLKEIQKQKRGERDSNRDFGYPDRSGSGYVGSDIYHVNPGDSWASVAYGVYRDEKMAGEIRRVNNSTPVLHPGMLILLPDRKEDARVPVPYQDFWNTASFAEDINAMENNNALIQAARHIEQIWPEHGDNVFISFDEKNDPYPTTDNRGMALYWNKETGEPTFDDTGIQYTMGMVENDWIKPLTTEEQIELTLRGEQSFRPEAMAYYAQAAEFEGFKESINELRITEDLPQDTAFLPSLHGEPTPTPLRVGWWTAMWDGVSAILEEPFRGVGNLLQRADAHGRQGYSMLQRGSEISIAFLQSMAIVVASGWTGARGFLANVFDKELTPYAVDPVTYTKLTPDEVAQREARGEDKETVRYMKPQDYWTLELDRATTTTLRWTMTLFDGHFTGIFRDQFASDDEYETYIGRLYAFYQDEQDEALLQNIRRQEQDDRSYKEIDAERIKIQDKAFDLLGLGENERAITVMEQSMRMQTAGAHWYSPYFMWSEMNEPWRYDRFMTAVAIATLENGEPLEPRVVRDIRRRYEHVGLDIMSGVILDLGGALGAISRIAPALRGAGKFLDLLNEGARSLRFGEKLSEIRHAGPVVDTLKWLVGEAHGSTGTSLKRISNNLSFNMARNVDASIGQPGVRGLDEVMELVGREIRVVDPSFGLRGTPADLPAGLTDMHLNNARRLANTFDPSSDLRAVQKINPDNWGGLVHEARDIIWNKEYSRILLDLRKANPLQPSVALEARAARLADVVASDPRAVAKVWGGFFEEAWRARHRTNLGPATLDDNIIVRIADKAGAQGLMDTWPVKGLYTLYYGGRNFLFEWWLGLRPAWTVINYIDSSVRSLISGAKLYDSLGFLANTNVKKLLSRNLIREEFSSTFIRGFREVEGGEVRLEPAIDRLLRGRKFYWGPFVNLFNVLGDARNEARLERMLAREGRLPTGSIGNVARFLWDQVVILKATLTRGALDTNSLLEFGLRERVFATHYDNVLKPVDKFNLDELVSKMEIAGADDATIAAFKKIWHQAGDDPNALEEMLTRAVNNPEGPNRQLYSEILPDNFEEGLSELGVDRRLRSMVFHPVVDELEDIIRNAPNDKARAQEVTEYLDNVIRQVNDEFLRRAEELGSQPTRVVDEAIQGGRRPIGEDAAEQVSIGAGHDEVLTITTEDLRIQGRIVYTMSDDYHARGALQRESTARLFDARRELRTALEAGEIDEARFSDQSLYLDEVSQQTRLFRDNVKQFMLRVFPGPLKFEPGVLREQAWDMFDRLGIQVYDSVISFTDEAIEASAAGKIEEIPSIQNMLLNAGIELAFDGTRFAGIKVIDDVMGTRTSFGGWRGTNWIKQQLIKSFFGPNVHIRSAWEHLRAPFTIDNWEASSRPLTQEKVAEQLSSEFGDLVGSATDRGIINADEAWQAFTRNPEMGAGERSIREMFGFEATKTRQAFIDTLEEMSIRQSALVGGYEDLRKAGATVDDEVQGVFDSIDQLRLWQDEIRQIGHGIDSVTNPLRFSEEFAPSGNFIPRWLMDYGIQTFLNQQRGLAAESHSTVKALEGLKDYLIRGLGEGVINTARASLDNAQLRHLDGIWGDAVWRKGTGTNVATDGVKPIIDGIKESAKGGVFDPSDMIRQVEEMAQFATGNPGYKGAVRRTQFDMLEYGQNFRFDSLIKFVSPFWMFQSRSPVFWMKTFAQDPQYLAWASRYYRQNRRIAMEQGATDSKGNPLKRFYGFWRIPGTSNWIAPLNPVSARYVFPRPTPYPAEFAEESSALDIAITHAYEYGRMFGFNPAPWITYPLYGLGVLDENRQPKGGIISQFDLIPPWIQRDIRRGLQMSRYPNDPGLFNPDVGWKDFLIQKQMLGVALLELQENPDSLAEVQAELYEAFGYVPTELNSYGAPVDYIKPELLPYREHSRWIAARDKIEKDTYYNQLLGFFTGIYPKEYTDAEAELISIKDEINFLSDSINSIAGVPIFALDPVAESRYETYMEMQWETPEGFLDNLYGSIRWTQTPSGGQAYGPERAEVISQRIWENEVTQAYYDSLEMLTDQMDDCSRGVPVGADSAVRRSCWAQYFEGRNLLDNEPIFDLARRDWAIGMKTDQMIQDRFEHMWWSYIRATRPKWFQEDGEPYSNWKERDAQWLEDLPELALSLAPNFLVSEITSRTGFEDGEEPREIPGKRILIEEKVLQNLISITNEEGYEVYRMSNDSAFDAMNKAFKVLRWDPWMEAIARFEDANSYERETAERAFLDRYGGPPEYNELARWVVENYGEDAFTNDELKGVYQGHGVTSIEEKQLPNTERGVFEDELWEMLAFSGPGINNKIFREKFLLSGGDVDLLDAWYETNGHISNFTRVQELHEQIASTAQSMGLKPPSAEQLVEWAAAKRLNEKFRDGVEEMLGEDFYAMLGIYGGLKNPTKREFRKQNAEALDTFFDTKEFYAKENQLWSKYYHAKFYKGGVGLPGEGAEGLESFGGGVGGGKRERKASLSGRGGRAVGTTQQDSFQAQGFRSTYNVRELYDPNKLGSGGIAGAPYWPAGFSKGVPQGILNEIVDLIGKKKELSEPAVTYLEKKTKTWKEYIIELMKANRQARTDAIVGKRGVLGRKFGR